MGLFRIAVWIQDVLFLREECVSVRKLNDKHIKRYFIKSSRQVEHVTRKMNKRVDKGQRWCWPSAKGSRILQSIYHDIRQIIAMITAKHESNFKLTRDTTYFTITGELWGVYCEDKSLGKLVFYLWSTFGDHSLNRWWVIADKLQAEMG